MHGGKIIGQRVKYIVTLTSKERESLTRLIKAGKTQAYRIKHASILLAADMNGPNERDKQIAAWLHCHANTVVNIRKRFVEQGLEAALGQKKRQTPPVLPSGLHSARDSFALLHSME
ncbi:MAG: hypothetical protein GWP14_05345, partial [Actinobacteria bacterium]|nr:hypothetical protein [Actinomycetota bacterium]